MTFILGKGRTKRVKDRDARSLCNQALVYLKPDVPEDATEVPLEIPSEERPVASGFLKGIGVCYLVNEGSHFLYIQNRHLHEAGWTREQLHLRAIENLAAFAQRSAKLRDIGGGHLVVLDNNFEASLLAVDNFWEQVAVPRVGPDIAAVIPDRATLVFCSTESTEAVSGLRRIAARRFPGGDHPISDQVYRRIGGRWTPLAP